MTVGFLGLGRMGSRMAANIAAAGFPLVVYNRTQSTAQAFAAEHGAEALPTPREVAEACDITVTMLADGAAARAVYLGSDGIAAGTGPGKLAIEMSTIGPEATRQLADAVRAAGGEMMDAPVSGSTAAAENRALMIMAAGTEEQVAKARPTLEAMGNPVIHVGSLGAGATLKLAVNAIVYGINGAVAESLVMAERAGIDRHTAYEVFVNSAVAAPVVKYRQEVFERPGELPVTFTVDLATKDIQLALELAQEVNADLPQAQRNLEVMNEASEAGYGDDDMAAIARYLRELD